MKPVWVAVACATIVVACGSDRDPRSPFDEPVLTATPSPTPTVMSTPSAPHSHIVLGASEMGSGQILADFDFQNEAAELSDAQCVGAADADCIGGVVVYSGSSPAFEATSEHDHGELHPLEPGTAVLLEVIALDPNVQVQVDGTILRHPGATVSLGRTPFHEHAVWQLVLPAHSDPHTDTHTITFRFRDANERYAPSPPYTVRLIVSEGTAHSRRMACKG